MTGSSLAEGIFEAAFEVLRADARVDADTVGRLARLFEQGKFADAEEILGALREAAGNEQVQDRPADSPGIPGQPD